MSVLKGYLDNMTKEQRQAFLALEKLIIDSKRECLDTIARTRPPPYDDKPLLDEVKDLREALKPLDELARDSYETTRTMLLNAKKEEGILLKMQNESLERTIDHDQRRLDYQALLNIVSILIPHIELNDEEIKDIKTDMELMTGPTKYKIRTKFKKPPDFVNLRVKSGVNPT